jgi:hypothetical protein
LRQPARKGRSHGRREKASGCHQRQQGAVLRACGWHQRPDHPARSFQFRRALGETQNGGGAAIENTRPFTLEGVLDMMRCLFLIVHGGHDVNGVQRANLVHACATRKAVDVTLRIVTAEETGADHCQRDNPSIGQELAMDWLADVFKVDPLTF